MSSAKPLIAVCSATGQQGRSVAYQLLAKKSYNVRALVRNKESAEAIKLQEEGAELVIASLQDTSSLIKAFKDVQAVYAYTSPQPDHIKETVLGCNIVDACKAQGEHVPWLVWSTCPAVEQLSKGKYKVPIWDEKAAVDEYAKKEQVPATFVRLGLFLDNLFGYHYLRPNFDNSKKITSLEMHTPIVPANYLVPLISIQIDLGSSIEALLDCVVGHKSSQASEHLHKKYIIGFGYLSWSEVAEKISEVTRLPVKIHIQSPEVMKSISPVYAKHIVPLMEFYRDYECISPADPLFTRKQQDLPERIFKEAKVALDSVEAYTRREVIPWISQQQEQQ